MMKGAFGPFSESANVGLCVANACQGLRLRGGPRLNIQWEVCAATV
jgi:hypothetical protein